MITEETKKEILDILDNVQYWETCPDDYKIRIERIKQALTIPDVNGMLLSDKNDDISIYAAYDKGKWCVAGYGFIKEPYDTPQEALNDILKERNYR